ncbi:hypothetical protein LEP1GSC168_1680 [Leptospira santarosai str. HAI134]|nr:hypothetical protein LEP1GSC168_1680 [Leptospira santarosai str. HAI134]
MKDHSFQYRQISRSGSLRKNPENKKRSLLAPFPFLRKENFFSIELSQILHLA